MGKGRGSAIRVGKQHPDRHKLLSGEPAIEAFDAFVRTHHGHQATKALCVFPSVSNVQQAEFMGDVVTGDHTRTIQIATPTVGGLMKFAVKTVTCLGCKTALKPTNSQKGTSRFLHFEP